jgi:hypothetical protein
VTFEGTYNARPRLSPDGKQLAVVHLDRGNFRIATVDLQSKGRAGVSPGRQDESPSFAPNGATAHLRDPGPRPWRAGDGIGRWQGSTATGGKHRRRARASVVAIPGGQVSVCMAAGQRERALCGRISRDFCGLIFVFWPFVLVSVGEVNACSANDADRVDEWLGAAACKSKPPNTPRREQCARADLAPIPIALAIQMSAIAACLRTSRRNRRRSRPGTIIYFEYDRAEIKPEFVPIVTAHAKYLNTNSANKIRLEGPLGRARLA